jgi:adenylate kinase family enzyme
MQRVAVIGCGGAGKTTVARELGRRLGLPLVEADSIVHGTGVRPEAEWQAELKAAADADAWVIDAMKLSILEHRVERADTVVFVDVPRRSCYLGLVQRRRWRRDVLNPQFLRWIWRFPSDARPRILAILERHGATTEVVVLRSRAAARTFLAGMDAR